jgi:peptidoglycan hydrolase-like protein with peptidoglycan-binding domain
MSDPELSRGAGGEDVHRLQALLNRVGAMLVQDGDFGRNTETGVRYAQAMAGLASTGDADQAIWDWLRAQPEPFPPLATEGVAMIAREETGGLAYYEQVTRWPHFPGVQSGITIGVGYDLRWNSEEDFRTLWGPVLEPAAVEELSLDIGRRGSRRRARELRDMGVEVPFAAAWQAFVAHTLPRFTDDTAGIYPSLTRLPDLCRSVLVSLVFNRGTSLRGATRAEMRHIRDVLVRADDDSLHKLQRKMILLEVEDQILAMRRLWSPESGLIRRRQTEANLWRTGVNDW